MPNTQFIFLNRSKVPGRRAWQAAIDRLDFSIRLTLDPHLQFFESSGFSPCQWGDTRQDVGFEIHYEPVKYISENLDDLKIIAGDKDYCITLSWASGRLRDCAAALIASCALAHDFDAVVSFQGEYPDPVAKLIADTRDIIIDAEQDPEQDAKQDPGQDPLSAFTRMIGGR